MTTSPCTCTDPGSANAATSNHRPYRFKRCPGNYLVYDLRHHLCCYAACCAKLTKKKNISELSEGIMVAHSVSAVSNGTMVTPVSAVSNGTAVTPMSTDSNGTAVTPMSTGSNVTSAPLSGPCYNYTLLNYTWESVYYNGDREDNSYAITCSKHSDHQRAGWYRLGQREESVLMLNQSENVSEENCTSYAPIWLNGSHLSPEDDNVTMYLHRPRERKCCDVQPPSVQVQACPGNYLVYDLRHHLCCYAACCAKLTKKNISELSEGSGVGVQMNVTAALREEASTSQEGAGQQNAPGGDGDGVKMGVTAQSTTLSGGEPMSQQGAGTAVTPMSTGSNVTSTPLSGPCYNYTLLNYTWESVYYNGDREDTSYAITCSKHSDHQRAGWYRLGQREESVLMLNQSENVSEENCTSYAPIWLNGSHLSPEDDNVTMYLHRPRERKCCDVQPPSVQVQACPGNYLVYDLRHHLCCYAACCAKLTKKNISELSEGSGVGVQMNVTAALREEASTSQEGAGQQNAPGGDGDGVKMGVTAQSTTLSGGAPMSQQGAGSGVGVQMNVTAALREEASTSQEGAGQQNAPGGDGDGVKMGVTAQSTTLRGGAPMSHQGAGSGVGVQMNVTAALREEASTSQEGAGQQNAPGGDGDGVKMGVTAQSTTLRGGAPMSHQGTGSGVGVQMNVTAALREEASTSQEGAGQQNAPGGDGDGVKMGVTAQSTTLRGGAPMSQQGADSLQLQCQDCDVYNINKMLQDLKDDVILSSEDVPSVLKNLDDALAASAPSTDSVGQGEATVAVVDRLSYLLVVPTSTEQAKIVSSNIAELQTYSIGRETTVRGISHIGNANILMCIHILGIAKNNDGAAHVTFSTYKYMERYLQPKHFHTENDTIKIMMSPVFSASLPKTANKILTQPVNFTLRHLKTLDPKGVLSCVTWNGSAWVVDGCDVTQTNTTHTVCTCVHFSTFALIMQVERPPETDKWMKLLNRIAVSIGLVFLALAVMAFCFCRWKVNVNNTARLNLCISLFLAQLLFLLVQEFIHLIRPHKIVCVVLSGILHYLFLSSFVWMSIEAVLLLLAVLSLRYVQKKVGLLWGYLCLIGYGVPLAGIAVSAGIMPDGYGSDRCWIKLEKGFVWSFLGPVSVILGVNILIFIIICIVVRNVTLSTMNGTTSQIKAIKVVVLKTVAQLFIIGGPWVLGFFVQGNKVLELIFHVVNSQQGTVIFLIHCVLNQEVREQFSKACKGCFVSPFSFLYLFTHNVFKHYYFQRVQDRHLFPPTECQSTTRQKSL
ncbi:uncharacterized protein LOC134084657 isoform X2 [Sardina pilchardus]|uniref:uncharacterized protein LOC134084657 isoform X2 n=1 Tax=Sardina pilchardus TaxID=27697 RepID=UPI002E11A8EA